MPKVSICIPTYNRKEYLKKALESVFAQTFKDYEVIVVDDGSTDETGEMIKQTGYNVRYYWQENAGDTVTKNKLIELAKGEFITFVDSDDLLIPDAIEVMVTSLEKENKEKVVYGNYVRIDEKGQICGRSKRILYSGFITPQLFTDIIAHAVGSMLSKKVLEEAGGFDELLPVSADYKLFLQLSLKYHFIALPEPIFMRRRHGDNISQICFENRLTEYEVLKDFYYNLGGKDVIPETVAMKRLAKEAYRAGKSAIAEGYKEKGLSLLKESWQTCPTFKCLLHRIKAGIL